MFPPDAKVVIVKSHQAHQDLAPSLDSLVGHQEIQPGSGPETSPLHLPTSRSEPHPGALPLPPGEDLPAWGTQGS